MAHHAIICHIMKLDGMKLRRERESKGLNQTQVAKKCKPRTTVVTISNAENGRDLYPSTAKRICDALNIELKDVMLPMEDNSDAREDDPRSRSTKRSVSKSTCVA